MPGALIKIDPSHPDTQSPLKTDSQGQAKFDLAAGSYTLSVSASGSATWTRQIDVQSAAGQTIRIKLEIALVYFGSGSPNVTTVDIPLESPEPVSFSFQPVGSFAPLPSHRARKHW